MAKLPDDKLVIQEELEGMEPKQGSGASPGVSDTRKAVKGVVSPAPYKSEYIASLISKGVGKGAEIHDSYDGPGGYIDDSFLLQPGDQGYEEGKSWSNQPYPVETEEEIQALIAAGAKDLREEYKPTPRKY